MDLPTQRMLKIGPLAVGVIGLDLALNRVVPQRDLSLAECIEQVFRDIREKNYIPPAAVEEYRRAIGREIGRLRGEDVGEAEGLVIRILGTGCVSCNSLQGLLIEIMQDMGIAADVVQVHDPDEIGRFGVLRTPALLINGRIKCAGVLPSRAQVEEWLREEV
ncbi:MAG: thioredoxin family protein [Desulfobulbaceae bacterium A2]|nr:MAG: thioredoxin family protein [Desulfobulbaceae bacterium A2]